MSFHEVIIKVQNLGKNYGGLKAVKGIEFEAVQFRFQSEAGDVNLLDIPGVKQVGNHKDSYVLYTDNLQTTLTSLITPQSYNHKK